jgi:Apea-like HEPN
MAENLYRYSWRNNLDQADLRLLLMERIGHPGQRDGSPNVLHLPLARDLCRVSLVYKDSTITRIEPGAAFDRLEWDRICSEIDDSIIKGPRKVGREFSFTTLRPEGWWRGELSGVQILPPPEDAPRPPGEGADNPFILEFPIQEASLWPITNYRRMREHRRLTLLLNVILAGTTKYLPNTTRHFWASVRGDGEANIQWVQEHYFAKLGEAVVDELSLPNGPRLKELDSARYYKEVGQDGLGLRIPADLDESICRYYGLPPALQAKFDRAAYWLGMASRQWDQSMSASFASLVSATEALTEGGTKHNVYCDECKEQRSHDVPGATEKFRAFFEKYAPGEGLKEHRSKMYGMRSRILHGDSLMQLDQGRAWGWDPPWWDEVELHTGLWNVLRIAARNWLRNSPAG